MIESEHIRLIVGFLIKAIVGIAMIAAGVAIWVGVWIPGIRGVWKGREKIDVGGLTQSAWALLFTCIGLLFLFGGASKLVFRGVGYCALAAFVLIFFGYLIDSYRHERGQRARAYRLPGETRTADQLMFWVRFGFVLLFALLVLITAVFHSS